MLALAAAPAVPHVGLPPPAAEAQPRPAPAPPAVGPRAAGPTATRAADPPVDPSTVVHEVQRGDDLWTLAERYYGQGRDWRRIAAANPDRLTGGPDRLEVGWRLQVPGALPVVTAAAGTPETVTVRAGDTLSALAEQELGDDRRWPELFDANRAVLDDPDELDVGTRLVLPLEGGPGVTRPEPEPEEPAVAPAHPRPLPPAADGAPPAAPTTRPAPAPPTPEAPTAETPTPETPTPETAVEAALPWPRSAACSPPGCWRVWPRVDAVSLRPGRSAAGSSTPTRRRSRSRRRSAAPSGRSPCGPWTRP